MQHLSFVKYKEIGAQLLGCAASEVDFDGKEVYIINPDGADNGAVSVSLSDIATKSQVNNTIPVDVTATYSSPVSPPPYMVGMVEIELDKETGAVKILDYQAVVDCGIPVNPNLARVQTEGGIGQGIGMALYENVTYNAGGKSQKMISCSTRYRHDRMWDISTSNLRQAMSLQAHLESSQSAR